MASDHRQSGTPVWTAAAITNDNPTVCTSIYFCAWSPTANEAAAFRVPRRDCFCFNQLTGVNVLEVAHTCISMRMSLLRSALALVSGSPGTYPHGFKQCNVNGRGPLFIKSRLDRHVRYAEMTVNIHQYHLPLLYPVDCLCWVLENRSDV